MKVIICDKCKKVMKYTEAKFIKVEEKFDENNILADSEEYEVCRECYQKMFSDVDNREV